MFITCHLPNGLLPDGRDGILHYHLLLTTTGPVPALLLAPGWLIGLPGLLPYPAVPQTLWCVPYPLRACHYPFTQRYPQTNIVMLLFGLLRLVIPDLGRFTVPVIPQLHLHLPACRRCVCYYPTCLNLIGPVPATAITLTCSVVVRLVYCILLYCHLQLPRTGRFYLHTTLPVRTRTCWYLPAVYCKHLPYPLYRYPVIVG